MKRNKRSPPTKQRSTAPNERLPAQTSRLREESLGCPGIDVANALGPIPRHPCLTTDAVLERYGESRPARFRVEGQQCPTSASQATRWRKESEQFHCIGVVVNLALDDSENCRVYRESIPDPFKDLYEPLRLVGLWDELAVQCWSWRKLSSDLR